MKKSQSKKLEKAEKEYLTRAARDLEKATHLIAESYESAEEPKSKVKQPLEQKWN